MRKLTFLVCLLAAACSSDDDSGDNSANTGGSSGSGGSGGSASATSCAEVCAKITSLCGQEPPSCEAVCASFPEQQRSCVTSAADCTAAGACFESGTGGTGGTGTAGTGGTGTAGTGGTTTSGFSCDGTVNCTYEEVCVHQGETSWCEDRLASCNGSSEDADLCTCYLTDGGGACEGAAVGCSASAGELRVTCGN